MDEASCPAENGYGQLAWRFRCVFDAMTKLTSSRHEITGKEIGGRYELCVNLLFLQSIPQLLPLISVLLLHSIAL